MANKINVNPIFGGSFCGLGIFPVQDTANSVKHTKYGK